MAEEADDVPLDWSLVNEESVLHEKREEVLVLWESEWESDSEPERIREWIRKKESKKEKHQNNDDPVQMRFCIQTNIPLHPPRVV